MHKLYTYKIYILSYIYVYTCIYLYHVYMYIYMNGHIMNDSLHFGPR